MKYYKALLFGSIGSIVETSEIQRKSFNKAFKQYGLDWNWTKREYQNLLSKSGGKNRISRYAKKKKIEVNSVYLRNLKTKFFNNYLKKNHLKLRPGVKKLISLCKTKLKKGGKILIFSLETSKNEIPTFFLMKKRLKTSLNRDKKIITFLSKLYPNIKKKKFSFKVIISTKKYMEMIKNRYISTLLSMSNNQILKGIDEINLNYRKILNFNDKLICLILNK